MANLVSLPKKQNYQVVAVAPAKVSKSSFLYIRLRRMKNVVKVFNIFFFQYSIGLYYIQKLKQQQQKPKKNRGRCLVSEMKMKARDRI